MNDIQELIKIAGMTADAINGKLVWVVRCKDCKHYAIENHYANFCGYEILAAPDVPTCHRWGEDACMVKPDGYCFLAERSEVR